ncbi:cation transporter [Nonomuraea antri]
MTALNLPTPDRRTVLRRRIRLLVAATITYNVIEAAVAITAGAVASSAALIGFGLDSVVEVASAAAVAWQFSAADHEQREKAALRVIAISFFALAAYVTFDAVRALLGAGEAEHSTPGLILAALSLVIMPFLSHAQRSAGRELGSAAAVADSKQTLLCTYLSGVLLVGLALNSLFGWSWADPIAALVIAAVAVKEGREAWRGDACCPRPGTASDATTADATGCADGCCQADAPATTNAGITTGSGPDSRQDGPDRRGSSPARRESSSIGEAPVRGRA